MSGFGLQGLLSQFFSFRSTLKLMKIIPFGLVQTKPVQSKTASLGPGPVRPSGGTGPDQALPQTGSVRTGGIIALESVLGSVEPSRLGVYHRVQWGAYLRACSEVYLTATRRCTWECLESLLGSVQSSRLGVCHRVQLGASFRACPGVYLRTYSEVYLGAS